MQELLTDALGSRMQETQGSVGAKVGSTDNRHQKSHVGLVLEPTQGQLTCVMHQSIQNNQAETSHVGTIIRFRESQETQSSTVELTRIAVKSQNVSFKQGDGALKSVMFDSLE